MPKLHAKIQDVLTEHRTFTTQALAKLRKLDSFLRENVRCNSLGWTAFPRRVKTTFTLSNGQVIPTGYNIEIPAYALSHDPSVIPDPDKFNAFRFYHAGPQTTNDLVSVSPTNMNFGYGRHACPGRFFAAGELKMILSTVLLGYDIRLSDRATERYQNMDFTGLSFPNPNKTLLFKSIT